MVRALVLEEKDGKVASEIREIKEEELPEGDVIVDVTHSTLNYKDGLILKGLGRLVRHYPHVPGIDLAGTVAQSSNPAWKRGDPVVLTGWRVGEMRWGGYAEKARVRGEWLVRLPKAIDARHVAAIGTAGFTAMLAVMVLEVDGVKPESGEVLVTGAAGGLGSVAVAVLAKLGFKVTASTGRADTHDYLKQLGASTIIDRASIEKPTGKPLESERWAACIDAVGGGTLANVLASMKYHGVVASCGLAGGTKLDTTVIPFLLRGVSLRGIDSVMCPLLTRQTAWQRLAKDLKPELLDSMIVEAKLSDLPRLADEILAGKVRGRVVVDVRA